MHVHTASCRRLYRFVDEYIMPAELAKVVAKVSNAKRNTYPRQTMTGYVVCRTYIHRAKCCYLPLPYLDHNGSLIIFLAPVLSGGPVYLIGGFFAPDMMFQRVTQ